jgi:hypothetical protein
MNQLQRRMDEATRELCCERLAVVRQGEGDAGWLESQMEATDSASRLLQLQSPRARGDATLSKLRQLSQAVKQRVNAVVLGGPRRDGCTQTPDLREDGCGGAFRLNWKEQERTTEVCDNNHDIDRRSARKARRTRWMSLVVLTRN